MASTGSKFELRRIDEKHYQLDGRGLVCPYPQLLVTRTLGNLSSDDVLEVILDNPPSVRDIPPALEQKGYKVNVSSLGSSTWKMSVRTEV